MKFKFAPHLILLSALFVMGSPSQTHASNPLDQLPKRVHFFTLKNGMRVLVAHRDTPTVSFTMYIRTGGLDDPMGQSGIAHMFEHMLFKGTKTIGTKNYAKEKVLLNKIDSAYAELADLLEKGLEENADEIKEQRAKIKELQTEHESLMVEEEYWKIYEGAGAQDFNAGTGYDYTNYTVSLPVNQVNLWMKMESERIRNPVLREFYKERSVVEEERRMRIDNSPRGRLWEGFLAAAFIAHPYGRPIVGWPGDISKVTRSQTEAFFKDHYDISRLVVGIVGGVDPDDIEKKMKTYFESIPSAGKGKDSVLPTEPLQQGERRVEVLYDAEPSVLIGYHRPDMTHPDSAALDVLANVLDSGRTSRFYKNIVQKKRIAVSVWAGSSGPGERDPNLFIMGGTPRAPHDAADLEKAIDSELDRLRKEGPTEEELARVKKNLEASLIRGLDSNLGLASQLAYYESVGGSWKMLLDQLSAIRNVTAIDVQQVLDKYIKPSARTVAVLVREEEAK